MCALWELKLNASEIAKAAGVNERTAQRRVNLLDGGIYETYHLDADRQLEGQVEADEMYQSSGSKGLACQVQQSGREPRRRGIKLWGRANAEKGRPPILGLVQPLLPQQTQARLDDETLQRVVCDYIAGMTDPLRAARASKAIRPDGACLIESEKGAFQFWGREHPELDFGEPSA